MEYSDLFFDKLEGWGNGFLDGRDDEYDDDEYDDE